MNIMQGDAYNVEFEVKLDGTAIDAATVETAEFMIGKLKKTYPDAVTYNSGSGKFLFPITQAESFALFTAPQNVQVRIKLASGDVIGGKAGAVSIAESVSKEVL